MNPGKKHPKKKADKTKTVQELEQEVTRLKEMAARAQADLQNAKDRMERDAREIRAFAAAGIVSNLLPTLDNFQRAFQHLPDELKNHEWIKGVQAMEQELLKKLTDAGMQKMECMGKPVDPNMHEVLMAGPGPKDTILQVFEEGYAFNGKVIRPAKVKVGDGTVEMENG